LSILRKAFDLAEDWGLRPEFSNPCRRVKRFPEPGRVRFLSEIELARLGEALREAEEAASVPPECIPAFRLYILTGCRHDEIRLLRWAYVDLDRCILNLPDSKTGPRIVHLNAPAVQVLKSIDRRSEWVIPSPINSSKPYGHLHRSWRVIRRSAGLEDLRIHDLRHAFASIGAAQGQSLLVIGSLLGHKQITTTQKYAHLADDPVRAANERIGSLIAATMNGTDGEVIQLRR
jgi:integrase